MASDFPGNAGSGVLDEDETARDLFFERHERLPCPALDPDTGCCDLYEARPLSCRTFGPPVRLDGEPLPPCILCFAGAPAQTVEACRITLDLASAESPLVRLAETRTGRSGETLVAMVLSEPPGGSRLSRR